MVSSNTPEAPLSTLGEIEQIVLLAILRLDDKAYGVTIRKEIRTCTDRDPARRIEQIVLRNWDGVTRRCEECVPLSTVPPKDSNCILVLLNASIRRCRVGADGVRIGCEPVRTLGFSALSGRVGTGAFRQAESYRLRRYCETILPLRPASSW
jgi:hypothetical protein